MKNKYRNKSEIIRDQNLKKLFGELRELKPLPDLDYSGRRVKLEQKDYDMRVKNGELSKTFITWYEENKDKEFIARRCADNNWQYDLEGVENWRFANNSFITVCDNCGEWFNMNTYQCEHCGQRYDGQE